MKPKGPRVLGISFSDPLVRAIKAGVKTQTRRPGGEVQVAVDDFRPIKPRYRVGDILYVREAWRPRRGPAGEPLVEYRADGVLAAWPARIRGDFDRVIEKGQKWRAARYMFRALARHWIVVEGLREEQLDAISDDDARAEGSWLRHAPTREQFEALGFTYEAAPGVVLRGDRATFAKAWNGIYEHLPEIQWGSDPEVHVYTFRAARPEEVPERG